MRTSLTSKLTCLVMAALIFFTGTGFNSLPPVEYTETGVIVRDIAYYNERLILSEDDRDLLIRVGIAEAGNQDVKGIALVICVVLNRWHSGRYGETLREVIYAPAQFYTKGMYTYDIWTVWDGYSLTSAQRKQVLKAFAALSWVTFNWDESEGALYFCSQGYNYYGPDKLFKYGDHWFSK